MRLLNLTDAHAYRVWELGLSDLTEAEIKRGTNASVDFTGFFSLPSFRELCKHVDQSAHGLPPVAQAYEEACLKPSPKDRQQWSHAAVYHAGRLAGWSDLHAFPRAQMLPRFEYHYSVLCKRVADGEDVNLDVPQAIPRVVPKPLTGAQNAARMAKMRAELGL